MRTASPLQIPLETMTIVRTDYRRKRPPKRKTSPVIPMRIVSAKTPGPDPKKLDASSLSDRHPPAPPAIAEAVSEHKPAQAAAITGPRIVTAKKPRPRSGIGPEQIAAARRDPVPADPPPAARQSAIVTAQSPKDLCLISMPRNTGGAATRPRRCSGRSCRMCDAARRPDHLCDCRCCRATIAVLAIALHSGCRCVTGQGLMAVRKPPERYWRSYGTDPLPTAAEAMAEPFAAFPVLDDEDHLRPLWQGSLLAETHFARRDLPLREIIQRMRHDGCGGRAGRVELATGIDGVTSRPVRKIVLRKETVATVFAGRDRPRGICDLGVGFRYLAFGDTCTSRVPLSAASEGEGPTMALQSPKYWRTRAEDARASAENMRDEGSCSAMRSVAHLYDSLADASQRFAERFGESPEGWADEMP